MRNKKPGNRLLGFAPVWVKASLLRLRVASPKQRRTADNKRRKDSRMDCKFFHTALAITSSNLFYHVCEGVQ